MNIFLNKYISVFSLIALSWDTKNRKNNVCNISLPLNAWIKLFWSRRFCNFKNLRVDFRFFSIFHVRFWRFTFMYCYKFQIEFEMLFRQKITNYFLIKKLRLNNSGFRYRKFAVWGLMGDFFDWYWLFILHCKTKKFSHCFWSKNFREQKIS